VWGPVLVFERLWEELGMADLLRRLVRTGRLGFDFERVVFALVLQRILAPGSDRAGAKWVHTVHARGFDELKLPHYYRALRILWQKKAAIEQALYQKGLDLFNQPVDLVFFDTTSMYFEGLGPAGLAKLGKSKDHRPDHPQVVVGVLMRRDGLPIGCEVWPGNTADVTRLNARLADCTRQWATVALMAGLNRLGVPVAKVNALPDVLADPLLKTAFARARDARSGADIILTPLAEVGEPASTPLTFPPRLGEHNQAIYGGVLCYDSKKLAGLKAAGII